MNVRSRLFPVLFACHLPFTASARQQAADDGGVVLLRFSVVRIGVNWT